MIFGARRRSRMKRLLTEYKIYDNPELQEFILSLEEKYTIEDAQSKYNNLVNFSENAETPYHKWLRYREGFAGRLIEEIISMSGAKKKEMILDPFSGSGTTPVVAVLNGYNGLGVDVNPMSAFITSAKTETYTLIDVDLAYDLIKRVPDNENDHNTDQYSDVKKYFNENLYNGLVNIKMFIDTIESDKVRQLFLAAYVCIIEDCSNRRRDGNGLKIVKTKVKNAREEFCLKLNGILSDIQLIKPVKGVNGYGIADTAYNLYQIFCNMNQSGEIKAGAIIFSPPYPNSFDYFESYKLELVMGGFVKNINDIGRLRKKAVRSFISVAPQDRCDEIVDGIAKEIENAIPIKEKENGKKDTRTRKVPNMLKGYFYDMQEIIRQCAMCLEVGRKTYIVVDQSAYLGKIVPTDLLLAYLAESVGFRVGRIISCRNAKTSAQQFKKYPYLKDAMRESIVELVKE
jgi:hypothetical protein